MTIISSIINFGNPKSSASSSMVSSGSSSGSFNGNSNASGGLLDGLLGGLLGGRSSCRATPCPPAPCQVRVNLVPVQLCNGSVVYMIC